MQPPIPEASKMAKVATAKARVGLTANQTILRERVKWSEWINF
jgi:hypothetical protein